MDRCDVIIIGGGASGCLAAISARRRGASVAICEKMPRLLKKVLASGNGRCNLLNETLDASFYNKAAQQLVVSVFSQFGNARILNLFKELGLEVTVEGGRYFPATDQASTVVRLIEMELERLSVTVNLSCLVTGIIKERDGFTIATKSGKRYACRAVILAGGGKTYPALGSDGSAYVLARQLGHTIVEPVPSAVPLVVKDPLCHLLQGQKIAARARALIDGKVVSEVSGEVLFTKYGLSGTAILDVSDEISIAVNRQRQRDVAVSVDMAPLIDKAALGAVLSKRLQDGWRREELFVGILPNRVSLALSGIIKDKDIGYMVSAVKDKRFTVLGTRGWNEAEFTAGGVTIDEVNEATLESKKIKGVYLAGEALDVHGKRGGYNLAWAWASGYVAGLCAK